MLERFNPFRNMGGEKQSKKPETKETSRWERVARQFGKLLIAAGVLGGAAGSAEAKQQPNLDQQKVVDELKKATAHIGGAESPEDFAKRLHSRISGTAPEVATSDSLEYASVVNEDGTKTPLADIGKKFDPSALRERIAGTTTPDDSQEPSVARYSGNREARELKVVDPRATRADKEMQALRELSPKPKELTKDEQLKQAVKAGSVEAVSSATRDAQTKIAETINETTDAELLEKIAGTDSGVSEEARVASYNTKERDTKKPINLVADQLAAVKFKLKQGIDLNSDEIVALARESDSSVTEEPTIASYTPKGHDANKRVDLGSDLINEKVESDRVAGEKIEAQITAMQEALENIANATPLTDDQIESLKNAGPNEEITESTPAFSEGTKRVLADLRKPAADLFGKENKLPKNTTEFLSNLDRQLKQATEGDLKVSKENLYKMRQAVESLIIDPMTPQDLKDNTRLFLNSLRVVGINQSDLALKLLAERFEKIKPYLDGLSFTGKVNLELKDGETEEPKTVDVTTPPTVAQK